MIRDVLTIQKRTFPIFGRLQLSESSELFIHRKTMVLYVQLSTNCRLDNFITVQILFLMYQKAILQLVENCKYGTIAFPCIKSSLVKATKVFIISLHLNEKNH